MSQPPQHIYEFGRFRLDAAERLLLRGDEPVPLTPKVFGILLALVEQSGHIVEKDELMRQVWPDSFVEEGNLTQNVSLLRKALGETSDGKPYIETVARRGYRFAASVKESRNHDAAPAALPAALAFREVDEANAAGERAARHAFTPEPFGAEPAAVEVAAGDNSTATASLIAAPSAFLSSATAGVAESLTSPLSTRAAYAISARTS